MDVRSGQVIGFEYSWDKWRYIEGASRIYQFQIWVQIQDHWLAQLAPDVRLNSQWRS